MSKEAPNTIEHLGRIIDIDQEKITVAIVSQSACVSCSVKGSCSVGDVEEKIVEVAHIDGRNFKINDLVTVVLNVGMGAKAVILGYFLPFLVLLFSVIIMQSLGYSEGVSGLTAIGMLVPYYSILYFTRKKQSKTFNFKIK